MDTLTGPQMSVLDAIAHAEVDQPWINGQRGGYGETVSNQRFDPNNFTGSHPYQSGNFRYYQGRYGPSSASGRYQETLTTYNDNVAKYGIPGFSPLAQDQRAFLKASDLYHSSGAWRAYPGATGDLTNDVTKYGGEAGWWANAAAPALHREWTSVPGGLEPNSKTRNWISNAVSQFGGGTPGQPVSEPEYSAEDAPGLLSTTEAGVASKATGQVPGVAYTPTPGILGSGGGGGGGGGGGDGGDYGQTGTLGSAAANAITAMAQNEPKFAPMQPMQLNMLRAPIGLAIARAAANRQMLGFPEYQQLQQMAYPQGPGGF